MMGQSRLEFLAALLALAWVGSAACGQGGTSQAKGTAAPGDDGGGGVFPSSLRHDAAVSSDANAAGAGGRSGVSTSGGTGGAAGGSVSNGGVSGGSGGRGGSSGGAGESARAGSDGSGGSAGRSVPASQPDAGRDSTTLRPDTATGRDAITTSKDSGGSSDGATGTGGDDCTDNEASGLTLQQIAVYQTVKIPIMTDGVEVAPASRNSSVIQGRDTTFRVFVTVGNDWTARELSARLTLGQSGGSTTQYFAKKKLTASSTDADLGTTFQIPVPASAMVDSTRYSVSLVECSSSSGTVGQAHFPASGDADLGIKSTGGLKIKIIPLQVGSLLPDTSQSALDGYASTMAAMYPVSSISITVGDTLTVSSPVDWTTMLDQVRAKRTKDAPASDVYYFGLVKPADSLRTYCQNVCTTGIGIEATSASQGSGRAAVGIGFADKTSALTMAHEVGHNHGRKHAPCAPSGTSMTGIDSAYPYTKGQLGSWGWDNRSQTLYDPAKATDIMGYCSNQWMSDYTYSAITTRVASVNGTKMLYTSLEALSRWRVLLLDENGPRWGVPIEEESAAFGDPETANIYDGTGALLTQVTVYRSGIGDSVASMVLVPEPEAPWYAVEVQGAVPHPFTAPVTVPRP